jgi:hypothetical protein
VTPEQQRIAIAEACGWRQSTAKHPKSGNIVEIWTDGKRDWSHTQKIPDYLNDLNAMHEVEKVLTDEQQRTYAAELGRSYDGSFLHVSAPAAQRAEAFLRTIGKWVES